MRLAFVIFSAVVATACSPPNAAAPPSSSRPSTSAAERSFAPPADMAAAFPNCTWEEIRAAGVAINSFNCPTARLVGDETLPGIYLVTTELNGAETRTPIVQIFAKPTDAPIGSVLQAVRAASPGRDTATCVFVAGTANLGAHAVGRYQLMPTGAALEAWEAYLNLESDAGARPCGAMGPTEGVSRTFEVLEGAPDKVVFLDWSLESGQVYYPESLRAIE